MNGTSFELTPNLVAFASLAGIGVLAALGVIFSKSAVRSALCLVVNFFVLASLYFTLNAEMLGIIQVVVYAGAIMVLFLFVIMLLTAGHGAALEERLDLKKGIAAIIAMALVAIVGIQVLLPLLNVSKSLAPDEFGSPEALGRAVFTTYGFPLEAVSILLVIGLVGSILLAKRRIS